MKQNLLSPLTKAQQLYMMDTEPQTVSTEIIKQSPKIFLYRHVVGAEKKPTKFVMVGPNGDHISNSINLDSNFDQMLRKTTSLRIDGKCLTGMQVVKCWKEHGL